MRDNGPINVLHGTARAVEHTPRSPRGTDVPPDAKLLYLDLLKKCLTRSLWEETLRPYEIPPWGGALKRRLKKIALDRLRALQIEPFERVPFDHYTRELGRDWPLDADTMIGLRRLDNIQECVTAVIRDDIPGDLVETGVWRGGASIFMRAVLAAYGDTTRRVWCADSFQGLPTPNVIDYPADKIAQWHKRQELVVSLDTVKKNFARYGMLDDQVMFLKGWFKDTLPKAPIEKCAVIRLDGDMYESTMDALNCLYDKLSPGGFLIIDDYGIPEDTCRRAIHDFRDAHGIREPIVDIDGWGAYWRRPLNADA
jgi:O-methyltransferase